MTGSDDNRGATDQRRRGVRITVSLLVLAALLIYLGFIGRSVLGI